MRKGVTASYTRLEISVVQRSEALLGDVLRPAKQGVAMQRLEHSCVLPRKNREVARDLVSADWGLAGVENRCCQANLKFVPYQC